MGKYDTSSIIVIQNTQIEFFPSIFAYVIPLNHFLSLKIFDKKWKQKQLIGLKWMKNLNTSAMHDEWNWYEKGGVRV